MATYTTHVPKEYSLKRKRSGEEKEAASHNVTKALLQFSSKQDVRPASLKSDTHIALLVGDGHGGGHWHKTAKCLSERAPAILNETLKSGVEAGMLMSQRECEDFTDGAMLVIALYEFATRKIEIISVGDASCSVYQNEALVHSQPHQDAESFMEEGHEDGRCEGKSFEGESYGTVEVKRKNNWDNLVNMGNKLTPDRDGETMHYPSKPSYMRFRVEGVLLPDILASGGFVGHQDVPRLPPVMTEFTIPVGPFHVVMSSDGVSDVMHPKDALARKSDVTAVEILEECKKRWTTPHWTLNGQKGTSISRRPTIVTANGRRVSKYQKTAEGYSVTYMGEKEAVEVDVNTIEETNRGADDISVLVFSDK